MLRNSSYGRFLFKVVFLILKEKFEVFSIKELPIVWSELILLVGVSQKLGSVCRRACYGPPPMLGGIHSSTDLTVQQEEKKVHRGTISKWWSALPDRTQLIWHSLSWISRCPAGICRMRLWFLWGGEFTSTWGRHSTNVFSLIFSFHHTHSLVVFCGLWVNSSMLLLHLTGWKKKTQRMVCFHFLLVMNDYIKDSLAHWALTVIVTIVF